jgi:16S rRNA (uracil1498-N3)-methyltransferase
MSATGVVAGCKQGRVSIQVTGLACADPPQPQITVVQALPKGDRGEVAVATMTEVGVDRIVPWAAARCVTRWRDERAGKSLERWRTTARESAKQSRRIWWPQVDRLASTGDVQALLAAATVAVVLHESARTPLPQLSIPVFGTVVLVVGPEGGVHPDELDLFAAAGASTARLGPTVLRTSTAGTVAAGIVLAGCGRWD